MTDRLPEFTDSPDRAWIRGHDIRVLDREIRKAMGRTLRAAREQRKWTGRVFVTMLPSGVVERTLNSYELGDRAMTCTRWFEVCVALGASPGVLMDHALQDARMVLETLTLRVDLHRVLATTDPVSRLLIRWARNRLREEPDGVVDVHPAAMRDLGAALGFDLDDLRSRLAGFAPTPELADEQDGD